MSAEGVRAATLKIADDFIAVINAVFNNDAVSGNIKAEGKNTLRDSRLANDLYVNIDKLDNPALTAMFNEYVVFLEWTRPPMYGKRPPIDALKEWAERNGIPTDSGTLWAISNAIWRDGHTGRPIFATVDMLLDNEFESEWSDRLYDAIVDNIELLFND